MTVFQNERFRKKRKRRKNELKSKVIWKFYKQRVDTQKLKWLYVKSLYEC